MKAFSIISCLFLALVLCGTNSFAVKPTATKKDVSEKHPPGPGFCSDPSATMLLTRVLDGTAATITMNGTVCNVGQADYAGQAPLDAHFMVYTWHPPRTKAQENDLKSISHIAISKKLKKDECRTLTQTYRIQGVAKWGHATETRTERPASKQLVFSVKKKYPLQTGDTDFSKTEDCDMSNNSAVQTVDYMEKK